MIRQFMPIKEYSGPEKIDKSERWWNELPPDEAIRVLVSPEMPKLDEASLTMSEKIQIMQFFRSHAVEEVIDYIQYNPETFVGIEKAPVILMKHFGFIGMSITPRQCENLMDSLLIESIIRDEWFSQRPARASK